MSDQDYSQGYVCYKMGVASVLSQQHECYRREAMDHSFLRAQV